MKTLLSCITLSILTSLIGWAEDPEIWTDDRITPEQPFRANVIGARTTWVSVELILESIEKPKKYLVADIHANEDQKIVYRTLKAEDQQRIVEEAHKEGARTGWHIITPGIGVNNFSSSFLYKAGRSFGEEDIVRRKWRHQKNEAEATEPDRHETQIKEPTLSITGHYRSRDGRVKEHSFPVSIKLLPDGTFKGTYESWIEARLSNSTSKLNFTQEPLSGNWRIAENSLHLKSNKADTSLPELVFDEINGLRVILKTR